MFWLAAFLIGWLVVIPLGLREITSSKYDEQWDKYTKKFNDWWFK